MPEQRIPFTSTYLDLNTKEYDNIDDWINEAYILSNNAASNPSYYQWTDIGLPLWEDATSWPKLYYQLHSHPESTLLQMQAKTLFETYRYFGCMNIDLSIYLDDIVARCRLPTLVQPIGKRLRPRALEHYNNLDPDDRLPYCIERLNSAIISFHLHLRTDKAIPSRPGNMFDAICRIVGWDMVATGETRGDTSHVFNLLNYLDAVKIVDYIYKGLSNCPSWYYSTEYKLDSPDKIMASIDDRIITKAISEESSLRHRGHLCTLIMASSEAEWLKVQAQILSKA